MEAPKKIYIPRLEGKDTFVHEWCETKYRKYYIIEVAENVEYTRTDAFIEKTCEWIKMMWSETDERFKEDYTGMLIENYKNYIKEE